MRERRYDKSGQTYSKFSSRSQKNATLAGYPLYCVRNRSMSPLDFRWQRKPAGLATKGRKYSIFEGVTIETC